jgi:hypothetical protein
MNFYFHWLDDSDRCVLFETYDNKILDLTIYKCCKVF